MVMLLAIVAGGYAQKKSTTRKSAKKTIVKKQLPTYSGDNRAKILMETNFGNVKLELFNETPLHRDNFLKLVRMHFYDSLLFHRVIKDFMIQCGDQTSKNAQPGQELGNFTLDYTVPAEFHYPEIFHKRGMLAAAREGDDVNPERASDACHFYIVWGNIFEDKWLDKVQARLDTMSNGQVKLTPEIREVYKTVGGTPHLDGMYTVFGRVIEGLDVVDKMQQQPTDKNDRPLADVRIFKMRVIGEE